LIEETSKLKIVINEFKPYILAQYHRFQRGYNLLWYNSYRQVVGVYGIPCISTDIFGVKFVKILSRQFLSHDSPDSEKEDEMNTTLALPQICKKKNKKL
jgi:hypothetical protein